MVELRGAGAPGGGLESGDKAATGIYQTLVLSSMRAGLCRAQFTPSVAMARENIYNDLSSERSECKSPGCSGLTHIRAMDV